jgi:predicted amidohydrolase
LDSFVEAIHYGEFGGQRGETALPGVRGDKQPIIRSLPATDFVAGGPDASEGIFVTDAVGVCSLVGKLAYVYTPVKFGKLIFIAVFVRLGILQLNREFPTMIATGITGGMVMRTRWQLAAVQMAVTFGDKLANLNRLRQSIREAAEHGAQLVIFPECSLTGYAFENKAAALEVAEPIPGPSTVELSLLCREHQLYVIYGLLERDGDRFYNSCVLLGPEGVVATYRKIHLPYIGADRFATPGDRPFAVHELPGLRLGMHICYDGSFPESARVMALLGADLVVLPTNWPHTSMCTAQCVPICRAMENHVYFVAVNRVGEEEGFRFIGHSRIVSPTGDTLALADHDRETILYAGIEPKLARQKHRVLIPGKHEINRIADRRPEFYSVIIQKGLPHHDAAAHR